MKSHIINNLYKIINSQISLRKKIKKINHLEKKNQLFEYNKNAYLKWDYFRPIITRLLNKSEETHKKDLIQNIKNDLINKLIYLEHLPFFFDDNKKDIIFFGHNRGRLKKNLLYDEYLDNLIKFLPKKKIQIFSECHFHYGAKYNYKFKRKYINYLNFLIKIKARLLYFFVFKEIINIKNINFRLELIFQSEMEEWWFNYLRKVKAKFIFIVNLNSYLYIVRAANRLKISVLEVQHGSPNFSKLQYNFSVNPNLRLSSPSYFLGWGKFWKKYVNRNYYKKEFISVGKNLNEKVISPKKKVSDILFLDQLQYRKILVNKAIELSKTKAKLIYRFHPNISSKSKDILKLKKNNIFISEPKSNNISKDLKNVKYIIGVASTALLELAQKGYKVLVLDSQEFNFNKVKSKKKYFGLKMIDNKKIIKNKVFEKINLNRVKKLVTKNVKI